LRTDGRRVYLKFDWDVNYFLRESLECDSLFHEMKIAVKVRGHVYSQEAAMNEFPSLAKTSLAKAVRIAAALVCLSIVYLAVSGVRLVRAQSAASVPTSESALLADFRRVEVASVSDAMEQLLGKRMYMSHRMHPIFTTKFAGLARTVQLKKDEGNTDPAALNGMLTAIDQGSRDSVYVMVVENGEDIAGMGGLMGTAMAARGYAGAVIDGGVRDVAYLRKIGFPVYATGIVPSTSVHHYRFGGAQIPVSCDGVTVNPGDIVVADSDGVAVVPREKAQEVLSIAQQMDFKEHSMYAVIEQLKSIVEAVKKFGRL
jgi:regulator of RNase E activity RraA